MTLKRIKEIVAATAVVVTALAVPWLIGFQEQRVRAAGANGAQVITLSGVTVDGAWTLDTVSGANYWWKTFSPATLYVEQGREVVLRLQSVDVHHRFYAPALGIGPVDVEPGHTELVRFRADKPGTYKYYCTSICGDCHFYMSGLIVVSPKGLKPGVTSQPSLDLAECRVHTQPPDPKDMVQWGRYLYQAKGCTTCHGEDGRGGVTNLNYTKPIMPAHDTLAEKFFLEEPEDANAFIDLLRKRVDLNKLAETPPDDVPQFRLVLTQYNAARDLIIKGKHCAKLDKNGPEPPLQMPSWRQMLTDRDVDSIIAYLLTLYPWEDEDEFEGDEE